MVVVAVVGGTGNVGKTIVDAFKEDGKHEVIVLARKANQLTKTLEDNKVHTVISTVLISLWIGPNAFREQNIKVLRQTSLEWTQFHNGLFLDYYGIPHVESYLVPLVFAVDIANRAAAIPGATGDESLSLTYTKDLGKFVVAALSLSKWDEALYCYSDQLSMKEIVKLAEEATGTKFDVTYDSVEKLRSGQITELPSHKPTYEFFPKEMLVDLLAKFGLWIVYGIMYRPKTGSLNEKFPEIKTTTAKEIIGAWKGK
ncbi:hypothetical protein N0V94_006155 [Neodidymelliopsis sp. IMI 364377]|nr:hypothetical protein N0V94_006155 [Neodidymelliopsis sp. IMI 364377]